MVLCWGAVPRLSLHVVLVACGLWINRIALCLESKVPVVGRARALRLFMLCQTCTKLPLPIRSLEIITVAFGSRSPTTPGPQCVALGCYRINAEHRGLNCAPTRNHDLAN
jgi:hypothetical protein